MLVDPTGEDCINRLHTCETAIKECQLLLAKDGQERLLIHKRIGDQLIIAKSLRPREFVAWVTTTFNRRAEWRSTHMRLATRWEDLDRARAWATEAKPELATASSVDDVLELLAAWDEARGARPPKEARTASTRKKASALSADHNLNVDLAALQAENKDLKRRLDEARAFRKSLDKEALDAALNLMSRLGTDDAHAEEGLRQVAHRHCWLFADLQEELRRHQNSGLPENPTAQPPEPQKESVKSPCLEPQKRKPIVVEYLCRPNHKYRADAPTSFLLKQKSSRREG
jgi:hypothetical protein